MKLLRSTKFKINKDKNGGNMPHLEITKVVLIYCNIINKTVGQLLDISSKKYIFLKTFNWEFSYINYALLVKILNL